MLGGILLNSKLKNDTTDFLFDAILSLETKEEYQLRAQGDVSKTRRC